MWLERPRVELQVRELPVFTYWSPEKAVRPDEIPVVVTKRVRDSVEAPSADQVRIDHYGKIEIGEPITEVLDVTVTT